MIRYEVEIRQMALRINEKYSEEEIDFLVSLFRKRRLDEVRKENPYGTYASTSKCPYCGK